MNFPNEDFDPEFFNISPVDESVYYKLDVTQNLKALEPHWVIYSNIRT